MASELRLVRIVLGGMLGRRFGPEWKLCVSSPAEAIRAIDANTRGEFRRYMSMGVGAKRFYKIALARRDNLLDPKGELHTPTGRGDIYILPAVKGRKSGGGKILAGVALIALAYFTGGLSITSSGSFTATFAGGVAVSLGASLILGGIVQIITPVPNFNQSNSNEDTKGGTIFQGNASAIAQGGCVPLVYGRVQVTPMPVSLSFVAIDQAIAANASMATQTYTTTRGSGGVIGYVPDPLLPIENLP